MLVQVYGEWAPSDKSCREWFRRFKSVNFCVEDKERPGQTKRFEDEDLITVLQQNGTCLRLVRPFSNVYIHLELFKCNNTKNLKKKKK